MYLRAGYHVVLDDLSFCVHFHVILVSVMIFTVFLCPPCLGILLSKLRRVFFLLPVLRYIAFLDLRIFVPAVSLPSDFRERGVDDYSFIRDDLLFFKILVESSK